MPLQKLEFRPGVNREGTSLANEGGWFESDKVRWRSGYPEKIGGWTLDPGTQYTTTPTLAPPSGSFWGVCRSMWNWLNLAGYNLLGLGTNLKYYIQNGSGGYFYDVTPIRYQVTISAASTTLNGAINASVTSIVLTSAASFPSAGIIQIDSEQIYYTGKSTNTLTGCTRGFNGTTAATHLTAAAVSFGLVATSNTSKTILLSVPGHGAQADDFVTISGVASSVGGVSAANLNKEFQVLSVVNNNVVSVQVATAATSTAVGGSGTTAFQITTGSDVYTTGVGWGAGGWGGVTTGYASTGWGSPASSGVGLGVQLRLWSETNFGEDLILNPRGGALYYWANNASPSTFDRAQIITSGGTVTTKSGVVTIGAYCPSVCNMVLVSDASRFVIAFGTNDYGASTLDPLLIRWSDQESFATWAPSAINQAGSYRLSHGSQIVGAVQTRQEILIWTDAALYSMQYQGPPYVWGFQIMADNISIVSPNAAVAVNNIVYWMGADKFYMYSGRVETLPCALRQYVFDDINMQQSYQFYASTSEGYNEIWWFYCSANSTVVDKYVVYNHLERTWYYGMLSRSFWLDSPLRTQPIATGYANIQFTGSISGTTLTVASVQAGTISVGTVITGGTLSTALTITALGTGTGGVGTYTVSQAATVATATLYGVPPKNCGILVNQETGNDDGTTNPATPIAAYCQSSDFDIGDGHNFGFMYRIIPDVTFDGSSVNNPQLNFTVRPRQFPGTNYGSSDNPAVQSTQNYSGQVRTYAVQQFTPQVYVRIRGRQMALRVESDQLGVAWQLGVPRIEVRPDGRR